MKSKSSEKGVFRNALMWEIPIEWKSRIPELSILCDPSHITGNRKWVAMVAQKALDMSMAGLMIESHITPDQALSDVMQQITSAELGKVISDLVVRDANSYSSEFKKELVSLCEKIDRLGDEIFHKLAARMQVSEVLGLYKKDNRVTVLQLKRWEEIVASRAAFAVSLGLSESFVKEILKLNSCGVYPNPNGGDE